MQMTRRPRRSAARAVVAEPEKATRILGSASFLWRGVVRDAPFCAAATAVVVGQSSARSLLLHQEWERRHAQSSFQCEGYTSDSNVRRCFRESWRVPRRSPRISYSTTGISFETLIVNVILQLAHSLLKTVPVPQRDARIVDQLDGPTHSATASDRLTSASYLSATAVERHAPDA